METLRRGPIFGESFYGYDREDVDAYLRSLLLEQHMLQQRVHELESTLEATIGYLQSRRGGPPLGLPQPPQEVPGGVTPTSTVLFEPQPRGRRRLTVVSVSVLIVALASAGLAYWRARMASPDLSAKGVEVASRVYPPTTPIRGDIEMPRETMPTTTPMAASDTRPDQLIVSMTTRTECWIAVAIDGDRPTERTLRYGELFNAHAHNEIVLRVGNAGAIALTINGRAAKQLGVPGHPATTRITAENVEQFLVPLPTS